MTVTEADLRKMLLDEAGDVRPSSGALSAILSAPAPGSSSSQDPAPRSEAKPKRVKRFLRTLLVAIVIVVIAAGAAAAAVVSGVVSLPDAILPTCPGDWAVSATGSSTVADDPDIPEWLAPVLNLDGWEVTSDYRLAAAEETGLIIRFGGQQIDVPASVLGSEGQLAVRFDGGEVIVDVNGWSQSRSVGALDLADISIETEREVAASGMNVVVSTSRGARVCAPG